MAQISDGLGSSTVLFVGKNSDNLLDLLFLLTFAITDIIVNPDRKARNRVKDLNLTTYYLKHIMTLSLSYHLVILIYIENRTYIS